jgi:hypothetical protein
LTGVEMISYYSFRIYRCENKIFFKYQAGVGTGNGKLPEKGILILKVQITKPPAMGVDECGEARTSSPPRGLSTKTPQNGESG